MASSLGDADLYAILGLKIEGDAAPPTAPEIKKAYRKRALELHPDKRPGDKAAAAEFDELQKAYEVLSDDKRARRMTTCAWCGGSASASWGSRAASDSAWWRSWRSGRGWRSGSAARRRSPSRDLKRR
ncbi:hypothetical protein CLOM_g8660 [Closterium sp. NIES-68]|nr:hypothetical protein CLOM_g8660 [Closterium sp. NIES-68]